MPGIDLLSMSQNDLRSERKLHIKAAKDLFYPSECIEELKKATSGMEMDRIMMRYRREKFKD